jgi:phage-related protein
MMSVLHGYGTTAEVWWWGQSKKVLSAFPKKIKKNLGYALRQLQWGEEPTDYRPLPSVAKGLFELRDSDDDGWYRVIYLSRTNDVIHVVHAFEKDDRKLPEREKNIARQNLKAVNAYLREEKKRAKPKK